MPAPYSLADIAERLGASVDGDASLVVQRLMHPLEASRPDDLIFVMAPELAARLGESPVRQVVLAEGLEAPAGSVEAVITVPRPRYALALLLDMFDRKPYSPPGTHPSAVVEAGVRLGANVSVGAMAYIGPNAEIGDNVTILPQAYIGAEARIGADTLIYPGVRIGERVEVGERVIIHNNASIGTDGFSYVTPEQASFESAKHGGDQVSEATKIKGLRRIASIGSVRIGDDVEIGACAAIDRSNIGSTVIGRGSKLDNHVQVGHNVRIGEDCLLSGQVGLAGSVKVGDRVVMAGQVGVADHLSIGDDAIVGGGSGLWKNVEAGQVVAGYPALPKTEALRQQADLARLPRVLRDIRELKRQVAELLQSRSQ